jgi:hypothetical protein
LDNVITLFPSHCDKSSRVHGSPVVYLGRPNAYVTVPKIAHLKCSPSNALSLNPTHFSRSCSQLDLSLLLSTREMFSFSLGRIVRTGTSHSISKPITHRVWTDSIAASPLPVLRRTHQRRHSSSKPSSPPDGGSRSLDTPAEATSKGTSPASKQDGDKRSTTRMGRRKSRDASVETAAKTKDETMLNLPSVPSTQHLHPHGTL